MFCSPFRRRRKARAEEPGGVAEESYLSREEAWSLYWAKLEEEANYFSVGDHGEAEPDICTCHTCIVSSIAVLGGLISGAGYHPPQNRPEQSANHHYCGKHFLGHVDWIGDSISIP